MSDVSAASLPNAAAIAFLRNKQQLTTAHWDEMLGESHAKAFTVAGATKLALLNDLHAAVGDAIEQGQSIGEFRNVFDEVVAEHGWTYKGSRGWRTRVIYDTNMRAANQAAQWSRIQETKTAFPFLQYVTAGDSRVRKQHADWDDTVLPVDHPWWNTHLPANGYGCRCSVRALSQRDIDRKGLTVSEAPEIKLVDRINTRTGEVYNPTPEGIDVGFDYNVGKAWMSEDSIGRTLIESPPSVKRLFPEVSKQLSKPLQTQFDTHLKRIQDDLEPTRKQIAVGYLHPDAIAAIPNLSTATISIDNNTLRALHRIAKETDEANTPARAPSTATVTPPSRTTPDPAQIITMAGLEALPTLIANPKTILQAIDGTLIYVLNTNNRQGGHLLTITPATLSKTAGTTNQLSAISATQLKSIMTLGMETLFREAASDDTDI